MALPTSYSDRTVCIVGLGYVGLTLAVTMAEVGFQVIGVEVRADVVAALRRGEPHFHEPNMREVLRRVMERGHLKVEADIPADCPANVYIITVGTPLGPDGHARLDMVGNAARQVARHFRPGALIIMRSTVKLGVTRSLVMPILESTGRDFSLAFCPERTVEGQALQELRYLPQIVGGNDHDAAVRAAQLFQLVTPTVVRVDSLESAEMIKLIDNVQRDVLFGFSNEVARLCDRFEVSAAEVIRAGRHGYPRTNVYMPGPVGGPCLSKDPYILLERIGELGADAEITRAARLGNERQLHEVADFVAQVATRHDFPKDATITLMGLAFKGRPATDDLRGTTALPILERLRGLFPEARFRGYDPVVGPEQLLAMGLEPCADLEQGFTGTHLALILNNHPAFAAMPINALSHRLARPAFIYDLWNNFDARDLMLPPGTGYAALGSHVHAIYPVGT